MDSKIPMSRQLIKSRLVLVILLVAIIFVAGDNGSAIASSSKVNKLPSSFGNGKILVRLYTDYFCGPCSRMEPKVEQALLDLIKKNTITLTLVDTPVHTGTPLYAKYFLYILNVKRDFDYVLKSRAILFEAASNKIEGPEKLEEFLKSKDIKFKQSDSSSTFVALSSLINEDTIKSTPTCVIIVDGKKTTYTGEIDITAALQSLK